MSDNEEMNEEESHESNWWENVWNKYSFFKDNNAEETPATSITAPVRDHQSAEYDERVQQELDNIAGEYAEGGFGGMNYLSLLANAEHSKEERVRLYREMEDNAYVAEALDEITFSSYNEDHNGEPIFLDIKNESMAKNDNIYDNLQNEFNHIIDNILNYKLKFEEYFREYVLNGEIALELIVSNDDGKIKSRGVERVKMWYSEQYVTLNDVNDTLTGFILKNRYDTTSRLIADAHQVAYADSGKYDFFNGLGPSWIREYLPSNNKVLRMPRSFIHEARKPYKQLDALEDSLVIYRLSRAPERLVFNVAVGKLPKNKAEQYLKKIINKFRKKTSYNAQTGEIDQSQNTKNMLEDYWFSKDQDGNGTDVTSIQSGQQLGEVEDINLFIRKLYKSMKVPFSRYLGESTGEQNTGMSREDIKFEKFIYMIARKFSQVIKQVYVQHLKLKGIWDEYNLDSTDLDIKIVPPSYFTYMKNSEMLEARFAQFSNFANNVDVESPMFSKRIALKEGLGWSDDMIRENEKYLAQERGEGAAEGEEDAGGDLGDEIGGDAGGGIGDIGDAGGEEAPAEEIPEL